ncbi:hypothetical protein G6F61_012462 [Rhizopus arrhizus]|nr:hypothetical protein G6F61_012462 [Rhizopus arrhizus]
MKALSESLATMLMNLDGKNDFDSIDKAFQGISCNRRQQPEEYWCRESVLNYLNLFIDKDSVSSFPTEQDLLQDMYGFIKATKHISKTTTETGSGSSASNYNKNMRRALGSINRMERQVAADHSNFTFKHLSSELECVEIGLVDHGPTGTKELQESKLKTPKMMRSFCSQIIEQYKIKANKIKIVSVIISGPYITAEVMTFNHGSIGLLYTSPRLKMPENIDEVPRLLPPALTLMYNCAQVIKNTAQFLRKNAASVNLNPFSNADYFFPPSFVSEKNSSFKKERIHHRRL